MHPENASSTGINKFWVWLALPVLSLSLALHTLLNLHECIISPQAGEPA